MASRLTDDELRAKLKLLGEDVGPITSTTRYIWEKKLNSLVDRQGSRTTSPTRTLNALSSDDSEVDNTSNLEANKNTRKKRHNHRTSVPIVQLKKLNVSHLSEEKPSRNVVDVFKKPSITPETSRDRTFGENSGSIHRKNSDVLGKAKLRKSFLKKNVSLNSTFDVETSDSDFDSETLLKPMRTLRLRNQNNHTSKRRDDLFGFFRHPKFQSSVQNGNDLEDENHYADQKQIDLQKTRKGHLGESLAHLGAGTLPKDYSANGYMPDAVLNGEVTGRTTNYSHCVSWMLVLGTAAFFVIIGAVYMTAVQKTPLAANKSHLDLQKCGQNNVSGCIPDEDFRSVLLLSREMHNLLSTVAGEYECQTGSKSRNLTLSATKAVLKQRFLNHEIHKKMPFDTIFRHSILLILKTPDWGIRLYSNTGELLPESSASQEVSALEATQAAKSLWCRLQHSIRWTTAKLMLLGLVAAFVCLIFYVIKLWKRREETQEKHFCELVEKIIDILQRPDDAGPSTSNGMPCKAVVHIRDMLMSPKERKQKQWMWDKAVAFIEENESRVRIEYQQIAGENHKMWRWLSSSTPESEGGKHGKVWQGQAFGNLGKGKNNIPYSPTPCLKIRNMFDPEVEYGNDWQVCIQDAILEKCEGNDGIVHIAVDISSNEGCVYMMCNSTEAAGKAFSALHGWWFDSKLVTVKYLRLERYLERFPSSEDCIEPLKPSNNKRLSLSAPFFSSALEKS